MSYRIMCDLDDVIYEFSEHFMNFTNDLYSYSDQTNAITHWKWWTCPGVHVTEEQFYYAMELFTRGCYWETMPLGKNVLPHILDLEERGAEIYYVTSRKDETSAQTKVSMIHQKIPHNYQRLIFCKAEEKIDVCREYKINIAIDDRLDTILQMCKTDEIEPVLYIRPHNRRMWSELYNSTHWCGGEKFHDERGTNCRYRGEWIKRINTVHCFKQFADIARSRMCANTPGSSE